MPTHNRNEKKTFFLPSFGFSNEIRFENSLVHFCSTPRLFVYYFVLVSNLATALRKNTVHAKNYPKAAERNKICPKNKLLQQVPSSTSRRLSSHRAKSIENQEKKYLNFRAEGSRLNNADEMTRKLWHEEFGVTFSRPGCMFRGNPPYGKLHPLSETFQKSLLHPRKIDVQIDKIQVSSLPADHPLPSEAVLSLSLISNANGGKKASSKTLFKKGCTLKKAASVDHTPLEITSEKPGDPLVKFSIGLDDFPKLRLKLGKHKAGFERLLPQRRHSLASSDSPIDIFGLLPREKDELSTEPQDICLAHKLATNEEPNSSKEHSPEAVETTVSMELSNERFGKSKGISFKIMVGSFYECIMPEDVEPLWGPIPLQKLPSDCPNSCRAVTHG